eukprot:9560941-Alexandrium_andersonii.AAC.1
MKSFWGTRTPLRFKGLVFRSTVYAALVDGLDTYVLKRSEIATLNRCLVKFLRRMAAGRAVVVRPGGER